MRCWHAVRRHNKEPGMPPATLLGSALICGEESDRQLVH